MPASMPAQTPKSSPLRASWARLHAAWSVLRGRPVIRNVVIQYGEVTVGGNGELHLSRAKILDSRILVRGPVVIRADKTSTVGGNSGNALRES